MIGQTISHYRILEKLGEGGMGVVYKAQDTTLNRAVALKFLPGSFASAEEISRFRQEAKTISALNHPNIATIYDFDESHGERFLALEYLPGGTLNAAIQQRKAAAGAFSLGEIVAYGIQIAEGLAHAHGSGIVHRDIKTENMMLTSEGRVKITDFGLAKLHGSVQLTQIGSTVGTAPYMSPEQIRGENVDHRSDLFSFGVVLFELATGQLPFRGDHGAALSYSIVHEDPAKLAALRPSLSSSLEQIVLGCLEKDVDKRYQQASEIVDDLRRLQSDRMTAEPDVRPTPATFFRKHTTLMLSTAALLFAAGGILFVFRSTIISMGSSDQEQKSIAVLPFVNVGADPNTEYLSDGITESLINKLSQLSNLTVMSRSSVFQYKGKEDDPQTAGKELGVQAVLTGRVTQRGDNLLISTEFVDVKKNTHIWGEQYSRKLSDLVDLQEEISKEISGKLSLRLTAEDASKLTRRPTEITEAYQLYLKGLFYWNKRTEESSRKALEFFEQSIVKDPGFTLAYVGLANTCLYLAVQEANLGGTFPADAFAKGKTAALKALALDKNLAEAHVSLAMAKAYYENDPQGCEQEYKTSIALNPNYATAYANYGVFLVSRGRIEESLAKIRLAQKLDPLSLGINSAVGWILYFAGQYDESIRQSLATLELDPLFAMAHYRLGLAYEQKAKYAEAIASFQKAITYSGNGPAAVAALGHTYAVSGATREARKVLANLSELAKQRYVAPFYVAVVHAGLGDIDRTFELLRKADEEFNEPLVRINFDPRFKNLRADSRFADLLKKKGLPN
jgi:serine/threonine-protein kinase